MMKVQVVMELICRLQGVLDSVAMYAFYSLLVYIFYTVFKDEEEEDLEETCGTSSDVCLAASSPSPGSSENMSCTEYAFVT